MMLPTNLLPVFALIAFQGGTCEYHSSTERLGQLLETELGLVEVLENYLEDKEWEHSNFERNLETVETKLQEARRDHANPLNVLQALRRIRKDWSTFEKVVLSGSSEQDLAKALAELEYEKPQQDDLTGAAKAIGRLQRTYKLAAADMARGSLMGLQTNASLGAGECFEIGRTLLEAGQPKEAAAWLIEARSRHAQATRTPGLGDLRGLQEDQLLGNLTTAIFRRNTKMALRLVREQLERDPTSRQALEDERLYSQKLEEERSELAMPELGANEPAPSVAELYERTCRGELRQDPAELRDLRCRYQHNDVPFHRIAPFRVEELSLDPYVAYYHGAIGDTEMEAVIATVEEHVERSKVGVDAAVTELRTSQNAWLPIDEHPDLANLARRLVAITGLSLESGEALQVVNYGIGGHYAPHFDFSEDDFQGEGNRLLTALFYINTVELGGATAFPFLRLAVPPIRGSLVLWHNLHQSLEPDYRTKHAGCPVLKGNKWVSNEWFHERGQEFRRPCPLLQEGYKSIAYKDRK